jgi:hypothetical protein
MDRPGPLEDGSDAQSIQAGVAVVALVDLDARHRVAVALVGQGIELAVAAVLAGAVDQLAPLEFPVRHDRLRRGEPASA